MKRLICILLSAAVMLASYPLPVCGAEKALTIDTARKLAVENSAGVRSVVIQSVKKEIELKQAADAIRDIRRAENTIRFSLLFNIKLPEKHGLPKEIELVMKIPETESELRILGKKERYEMLKSEIQSELGFYDVLREDYTVGFYEKRIEEAKKDHAAVEKQYKIGEGKKQDVEYIANQIKAAEKSLQSAILNSASKKRKLGELINTDVSTGYIFNEYLPQVNIKREQLPEILDYSVKNDFTLFEAAEKRKIAEREVNELLDIYKSKYGGYINDIQSYIANNRNRQMDYRRFIQLYNHALTRFDSPWDGNYVINFIFFKIRIPKEWFKGTYSGTRYLEDQKYALFVALTELDIKKEEESVVRKNLEESIYDAYETLKVMERAYGEANDNLADAEKNYADAYKSNMLGLTSFTELESARSSLYDMQKSLYEMRIDYAKELSSFDLQTSGYIRNKLTNQTQTGSDYAGGKSFKDKAEWYIHNYMSEYNFVFGINIPDEYGVTEYELCYDGLVVGKRMKSEEEIIHLPITYADNSILVLRLYGNSALKYLAYFDGGEYGGELNLIETNGTQKTAGICSISAINEIMSRFSPTLNTEYDYDSYGLLYNGTEFATERKGTAIEGINMYFSNTELLELRIYKNGKPIKEFYLKLLENSEEVSVASIIEK